MGSRGYYSKASGTQWVYPPKHKHHYQTLKNNQTHTPKDRQKAPLKAMDYFERKLDDKRRLTIPTELRDEFSDGLVLTRGFKQYLHLYPQGVWDQEVEAALSGSILDEHIADLNVRFRTGKTGGELDAKQGRITIEQHLLDYAKIDRDVIVVRAGRYWRISAAH